jgi:hypothetical protein
MDLEVVLASMMIQLVLHDLAGYRDTVSVYEALVMGKSLNEPVHPKCVSAANAQTSCPISSSVWILRPPNIAQFSPYAPFVATVREKHKFRAINIIHELCAVISEYDKCGGRDISLVNRKDDHQPSVVRMTSSSNNQFIQNFTGKPPYERVFRRGTSSHAPAYQGLVQQGLGIIRSVPIECQLLDMPSW